MIAIGDGGKFLSDALLFAFAVVKVSFKPATLDQVARSDKSS